ncbi:hypothetical protein F4780DRAFT_311510 [Xylariomycetidae sp. FL0641]|nr:hypothetical protein F4780DRAFT_311510 [Xylariomycetidae sp. FL0641]
MSPNTNLRKMLFGSGPEPVPAQQHSGTRGLAAAPYRPPGHFTQRDRRHNPLQPVRQEKLAALIKSLYTAAGESAADTATNPRVIVWFYHCETLKFSSSYEPLKLSPDHKTSPDVARLVSSAVAFLGECKLEDSPETSKSAKTNKGYAGLNVEQEAGGVHLHFPDHAGSTPFFENVDEDWKRVMQVHAERFPDAALLVGVAPGWPSDKCQCGLGP